MKTMKTILLLLFVSFHFITGGQELPSSYVESKATQEEKAGTGRAFQINEKLGRGVNLGNGFESPRNANWGLKVKAEYLEIIADKGFSHVRVPIRWNDYAASFAPYTIEPWFMDTIRKVVDAALENKLYVMINIHHYDEFNDAPTSSHRERFLSIWKQIAMEFKDYPDSVLFEFLNEPHQNMSATYWNAIYQQVLDSVRLTNPTRICVVGPPDWNGTGSVDKLVWTADTNMILTVHYYNPFQFTHQGASWVSGSDAWLGTTWDSTAAQRQAVINDFAKVRTFSETHNVPVHVGEFGAYSTADQVSRRKWTAYVARTFESFGFSWAYWEFGSGFGVYDPANEIWRNFLLNALTEQIDPNSIPPDPWDIRNGTFENESVGWNFQTGGEAVAVQTIENEAAAIAIENADGSNWHVQFTQNSIALIQGGVYRLSFDAWAANAGKSITVYLGKNSDPYNTYSGFKTFTIAPEQANYSFEYTMADPSDNIARLVFDLGADTGVIYLDNILHEQLSVPVLVEDIILSPDPAVIAEKEGTIQLMAAVAPEDANNKSVVWEIVSGQNLATLTSEGLLTATGVADGSVRVKASSIDGSGTYSEIFVQITNQLQVETITLTPTKTAIDTYKGSSRIFFEVLPAQASNKALVWSLTEGGEIATVSQSGTVDALGTGDGNVTVRASSTDGSDVFSEVIISLSNQVLVESIEIHSSSAIIDVLQGSLQLTAVVLPENASRNRPVWKVTSGESKATVDSEGLLTATGFGNGEVTVRASANDGSGVFGETGITLSNQGAGLEAGSSESVRVWSSEERIRLRVPAVPTGYIVKLYSVEGKLLISKTIPPFTSEGVLEMEEYETAFYFVEIANSETRSLYKVVFGR